MKTLIILGAGDGSVPTYLAARRLGHRIIGVDRHDWEVAVPLADEFLHVSTHDPDRIQALLGDRSDIAGVLAPSSDIALPTLNKLAAAYGTPGLGEAVTRASVDKANFHDLCVELGAVGYRLVEGTSVAELTAAVRGLRFPLFVKPTDGTGSRGIRLCRTPPELEPAIRTALEVSPSHVAVVEECVAGTSHTLEGFVSDGRLAFAAFTDRVVTAPPHAVTRTHHAPSRLPAGVREQVADTVQALCERLGYTAGPLDVDLIVTPDETVHLIEMGARVGGSGVTDLVRHAYGVDVVEASVNAAVGLPADLQPLSGPRFASLTIFGAENPGVLTAVHGEDAVRALPETVELRLVVPIGRRVDSYAYAAAKLGCLVLAADSAERLAEAEREVARTLRFTISPLSEEHLVC